MKERSKCKKCGSIILSLVLMLSLLLTPCAAFAETAEVPMFLTVSEEPLVFDITENIQMTATQGQTTLAFDRPVTVNNNGTKTIQVSSIALTPASGWTLEASSADFTAADKKTLSFTCDNGSGSAHDFAGGAYMPTDLIGIGASKAYTLGGQVSAKADIMAATQVATMVVTLEKYTAFLSFSGNEDFTLKTNNTTKNWDGTLEYSTDTATWSTWDGKAISSAGNALYLRGTDNTKISGVSANTNCTFVFTGTDALKIACEGNIENLLDYKTVLAGEHPAMAEKCYANLFRGCTSLTTAPSLPATELSESCYNGMFMDCTSLTSAPELPALKLADLCYGGMFMDCTSLTTLPSLPATELPDGCYWQMFRFCTNIKLSATQTGDYQTAYRIPTSGTGTTVSGALNYMFANTGGTFIGKPDINTTYYTSNNVV